MTVEDVKMVQLKLLLWSSFTIRKIIWKIEDYYGTLVDHIAPIFVFNLCPVN